jgi:hypothetical protein
MVHVRVCVGVWVGVWGAVCGVWCEVQLRRKQGQSRRAMQVFAVIRSVNKQKAAHGGRRVLVAAEQFEHTQRGRACVSNDARPRGRALGKAASGAMHGGGWMKLGGGK